VWLLRSPDLIHADFNLWEHLKSVVCVQPCSTQEDLWKAIEVNGTAIRNIVACCLKAGICEAEQTSIASQRFDNTSTATNKREIAIAR
jgi:hypothetical protein